MTFKVRRCLATVFFMLVFACRPMVMPPPPASEPPPPAVQEAPAERAAPEAVQDELHRREGVAAALTEQGRALLAEGQVDSAIRFFEQALAQSPHFGPGYYYLAVSWLKKENASQARVFHDQATLYLRGQPAWQARLDAQGRSITQKMSELVIP